MASTQASLGKLGQGLVCNQPTELSKREMDEMGEGPADPRPHEAKQRKNIANESEKDMKSNSYSCESEKTHPFRMQFILFLHFDHIFVLGSQATMQWQGPGLGPVLHTFLGPRT